MDEAEINEVRQMLGLTINEICCAMGVDRGTWDKWAAGTRKPNNAAVRLMRCLLWLHDRYPLILARMLMSLDTGDTYWPTDDLFSTKKEADIEAKLRNELDVGLKKCALQSQEQV